MNPTSAPPRAPAYSTARSKALYERAARAMVEGGSSPSRGPANYGDYPIFIERGAGARVYDVDGNAYIDWMMAYGALPLGHADARIAEAVAEAAATGALFAAATEIEIEVAELIQRVIPGAEKVRFANTGTEAMMAALRLARGYTGRPKFIKFEGQYHGWHDDFLVNSHPQPIASLGHRRDPIAIADSSGLNRRALEDTIVVPWNDIEAARRAVETHGRQIAAIVTEGIMANMGVIPPAPGYLEGLQGLAREIGALFVLDETVTGFRIGLTGCAGHYGLDPDIRAFGKALGGGLPVAAIVGRAEIMEAMAWGGVLHYGTQNASRVGMHAARANLRALSAEGGAAIEKARSIGERLAAGLNRLFEERGERAVVQGVGPMLQILFTERPAIRDYREFCAHVDRAKFQRLAWALFKRGVYMSPAAALHSVASAAHEPADVAATIEAVAKALDEIENG